MNRTVLRTMGFAALLTLAAAACGDGQDTAVEEDPVEKLGFDAVTERLVLEATIPEIQEAMEAGRIISADLVAFSLARIAAYDSAGPELNALIAVNPKAQIVVVAHSRGVDFLMTGARDRRGNSYSLNVEQLKTRGVRFDVCDITLQRRSLNKGQFISDATFVPSGVAEITRLQQREGYAYLRP